MGESTKAVFLSYASQDAAAAQRLADALRAAGVEVWFDLNELQGGDAWDQKIRGQVTSCALFVPIISAATQARREGYFRLEWKLADDRTHLMAKGTPFLLPVCVDDTRDRDAIVPDSFTAVQWTRLPSGETPPAFGERVKKLMEGAPVSHRRSETAVPTGTARKPASPRWPWVAGLALVAVLVITRRPFASRDSKRETQNSKPPAASAAVPLSEARQLAVRARGLFDGIEGTRDHYRLAEELIVQAKAKDPTDAEICAAEAQLHQRFIQRGWDTSDARREASRAATQRAIGLDPHSFEARLALANLLGNMAREGDDKERQLRELQRERPSDQRVIRSLAAVVSAQGRLEEALAFDDASAALPGGDPLALYNKSLSYWFAGRTAEAETAIHASLAQQPFTGALLINAWYRTVLHADLDGAHAALNQIAPAQLLEDRAAFIAYIVELWAHQPDSALARLVAVPREWIDDSWYRGPKSQLIGDALQIAGRPEAAALQWRTALRVVDQRLTIDPNDFFPLVRRVYLLARLGDREEATRQFAVLLQIRGFDLTDQKPVPVWVTQCCVLLGRKAEAIQQLTRGLKQPRHAVDYTAAVLRFDPMWEPLRTEPEFAGLIAEAEAVERAAGAEGKK